MGSADVAYNRTSNYLDPDDFILVVDPEGNEAYFRINRYESMGVTRAKYADDTHLLAGGDNTGSFDAEWLAAPRENRIFQIVPYFEFRWQTGVPANLPDPFAAGRCVPPDFIPCSIDLRVSNPSGTRRLGVPASEKIKINDIDQLIGGLAPSIQSEEKADGTIPHYFMPLRDDPSHVWDMWTIFGGFPAFDIVNRSRIDIGGAEFFVEAFLCFIGRRYMIEDVSSDDVAKLDDHLPGYEHRSVTVGGISQVTTRA